MNKHEHVQHFFTSLWQDISCDIEVSVYAQTLKALYRKIQLIDRIKNSLVKLEEEHYCSQILFRSLVEHYLLAYYFFLKCTIDSTDKTGEDYYDRYANSEFFKEQMYGIHLDDLKKRQKRKITIDTVKELYPSLTDMTDADLQEYHKGATQFTDMKKIGDYLIANKDFQPFIGAVSESIFNLLERYNVLSSFVHGGPYAERQQFDPKHADPEPFRHGTPVEWAYTLSAVAKTFLVLILRNEFPGKYAQHFTNMYAGNE